MGPAGGHLFILFNYEMSVSAGPQAVRAAWVSTRGIRHVCGIPNLCLNLCLLLFFWLRFPSHSGSLFLKTFWLLVFDLATRVLVCCAMREAGACVLRGLSQ